MSNQIQPHDGRVFVRALADPDAFSALFTRHSAAVQHWLLARTRQRDVSLDMTVETFARAWENRHTFRIDVGDARPWLLSIAHSVLVDSIRRREVELRAVTRLALERTWLTDVDVSEQWINDVLIMLPSPQRTAVQLRFVSGLSYAQIARQVGCSRAAAKMRVQRALQDLRSTMGSDHDVSR